MVGTTHAQAHNGDVRSVALLCLNAYARDAAPPTHAAGHEMLARSGHALEVVHGLLGALDDLLDMHGCVQVDAVCTLVGLCVLECVACSFLVCVCLSVCHAPFLSVCA